MPTEPTEEARRAAERIRESFYAKDLDRGYGQCPPRMLLSDAELAQIIDSETRCGELRKALEECPLCHHAWAQHDPEDGRCDAGPPCKCGRDLDFMQIAIAALSRNALNGGPQ